MRGSTGSTVRMPERTELGHICTLSALIFKGHYAHILHVGDSRIWRVYNKVLEPLTVDHVNPVTGSTPQLSRALGLDQTVTLDYSEVPISVGDIFLLTTDGVHDHWNSDQVLEAISTSESLDAAAKTVCAQARMGGSRDDLTVQIARVDALPGGTASPTFDEGLELLPIPKPGDELDGFRIVRKIHENNRSHIFLAVSADGTRVALKMPASETKSDPTYMRLFLMEEWIARRISSPHVVRAAEAPETRSGLYVVTEYIEGKTLRQWMRDNPHPPIETVRDIAKQMITGLRAFHRRDMLHQDFRPENLMIDSDGTVKVIDLGSTRIEGIEEAKDMSFNTILGTLQYTAPEYFVGDPIGPKSDQFSLGVILYEMLTGRLPYGADAARVQNRRQRSRLSYRSAIDGSNAAPFWIDDTLRKATHPISHRRFAALSELEAALHAPAKQSVAFKPLAERNPLRFWQAVSATLAVACLYLVSRL
ncbi:MAG: protein kinase [Pseudomonadota bacterium]